MDWKYAKYFYFFGLPIIGFTAWHSDVLLNIYWFLAFIIAIFISIYGE